MYEADGTAGHMTMAMQCRAIKMKIVDAGSREYQGKGLPIMISAPGRRELRGKADWY